MKAQWRQIATHYRQLILSGTLTVGEKLPTTQELAENFQVSVFSVQSALSQLVHEGLLVRRPQHGTLVSDCLPRLRLVGLVLFSVRGVGINNYNKHLAMEITAWLRQSGRESLTILEDVDSPDIASQLKTMIRELNIQGLILFATRPEVIQKLKPLQIPLVATNDLVNPRYKLRFEAESTSFAAVSTQALAELGSKRPAILTQMHDSPEQLDNVRFFDLWRQKFAEHNLPFPNNDLLATFPNPHSPSASDLAVYAYQSMQGFLRLTEPPDAVIVYTDELIPGVNQALAVNQIQVPEQLRLVLHRNAEIPVFTPYPYSKVELRIFEVAQEFVAALDRVFAGEKAGVAKSVYYLSQEKGEL